MHILFKLKSKKNENIQAAYEKKYGRQQRMVVNLNAESMFETRMPCSFLFYLEMYGLIWSTGNNTFVNRFKHSTLENNPNREAKKNK